MCILPIQNEIISIVAETLSENWYQSIIAIESKLCIKWPNLVLFTYIVFVLHIGSIIFDLWIVIAEHYRLCSHHLWFCITFATRTTVFDQFLESRKNNPVHWEIWGIQCDKWETFEVKIKFIQKRNIFICSIPSIMRFANGEIWINEYYRHYYCS